mmetsp:Transcript_354/g.1125  ORF Transcript_354/g.1125 Transcript_354/m.1125 type:complete len:408 (-) Transcript_354:185-1408(-)
MKPMQERHATCGRRRENAASMTAVTAWICETQSRFSQHHGGRLVPRVALEVEPDLILGSTRGHCHRRDPHEAVVHNLLRWSLTRLFEHQGEPLHETSRIACRLCRSFWHCALRPFPTNRVCNRTYRHALGVRDAIMAEQMQGAAHDARIGSSHEVRNAPEFQILVVTQVWPPTRDIEDITVTVARRRHVRVPVEEKTQPFQPSGVQASHGVNTSPQSATREIAVSADHRSRDASDGSIVFLLCTPDRCECRQIEGQTVEASCVHDFRSAFLRQCRILVHHLRDPRELPRDVREVHTLSRTSGHKLRAMFTEGSRGADDHPGAGHQRVDGIGVSAACDDDRNSFQTQSFQFLLRPTSDCPGSLSMDDFWVLRKILRHQLASEACRSIQYDVKLCSRVDVRWNITQFCL